MYSPLYFAQGEIWWAIFYFKLKIPYRENLLGSFFLRLAF